MGATRGVNECCCGCSLKTGCILIGGLSLLSGSVTLVMIMQSVQDSTTDSFVGYGHYSTVGIYMSLVFAAIVAFCQVVMGILLIKGADMCRPQLVRPWLLFSYFKFGMDLMSAGFAIYTAISSHSSVNYPAMLAALGVALSIEIYCIMVVYSFYKQLVAHGDIHPLKEQI
ncbi:uncharacterized protein [Anabrus simplex]|uniref:uncharacterized protein isoform X2 n=1 Tax=Anabrus simplex TaxID=316456 RepID=UPI0034DCC643